MRKQKRELLDSFHQKKLVIGVLLGGFSSEREISLKSGSAVAKALRSLGYPVQTIDVTSRNIPELDRGKIEVAFIALHGKFGEDGGVQTLLEEKGIVYTGSGPQASQRALDKFTSKETFLRHNIPTAPYLTVNKENWSSVISQRALDYPVVVKPRAEGSSVGVSLVKEEAHLSAALEEAAKFGPDILIEKYLAGREVTVGILGNEALPIIELRPKLAFFSYQAKYQDERTEYVVNPDIPVRDAQEIQKVGLAAHRALGCEGFSRVDLIYAIDRKPYVLEVNSIPGMTERSLLPRAARAIGIEFPQLCERIIELALSTA